MASYKEPELGVGIRGWRGLDSKVYSLRTDKFDVPILSGNGFTDLKPGEETEIISKSPIPKNANVKDICAKLLIFNEKPADIPEKATVGVDKKVVTTVTSETTESENDPSNQSTGTKVLTTETTETYGIEIGPSIRPTNVKIRLDHGDIFWAFPGVLVNDEYNLPNFAEQVNAYLDKVDAAENDKVPLRFFVRSDGPGKVKIDTAESPETLKYSLLKTQTWENKLDGTHRFDRNLKLDFGMIETIYLDPVIDDDTSRVRITKIGLDIGGEFGKERLLGGIETHDGKEFATLSSEYSISQCIKLDAFIRSTQCVGVCGFLKAMEDTELYIEIQTDENGFPSTESPLTKSKMTLKPLKEEDPGYWVYSAFEKPIDLEADESYWIVIKGVQGSALLGLQKQADDTIKKISVNKGGRLWKNISTKPSPALLRIVYLPEIDSQTAAIEIGVNEASFAPSNIDPGFAPQTVSLDVNKVVAKNEAAIIVIKSNARGTLSIANVIQEYSLK